MGWIDRSAARAAAARGAAAAALALCLVGACSSSGPGIADAGRPDATPETPPPITLPYGGDVWLTRITDETGATRARLTALFINDANPESTPYPLKGCAAVLHDDLWPAGLPPERTYASAGAISITLPGGDLTIEQPGAGLDFLGRYHTLFYTAEIPVDDLLPESYHRLDLGDVGPFEEGAAAWMMVPPAYQPMAPDPGQTLTLDPTADLVVAWAPPTETGELVHGAVAFFNQIGMLTHLCWADSRATTLTIPAATIADLPASGRMVRGLMAPGGVTTTHWGSPRGIPLRSLLAISQPYQLTTSR